MTGVSAMKLTTRDGDARKLYRRLFQRVQAVAAPLAQSLYPTARDAPRCVLSPAHAVAVRELPSVLACRHMGLRMMSRLIDILARALGAVLTITQT